MFNPIGIIIGVGLAILVLLGLIKYLKNGVITGRPHGRGYLHIEKDKQKFLFWTEIVFLIFLFAIFITINSII